MNMYVLQKEEENKDEQQCCFTSCLLRSTRDKVAQRSGGGGRKKTAGRKVRRVIGFLWSLGCQTSHLSPHFFSYFLCVSRWATIPPSLPPSCSFVLAALCRDAQLMKPKGSDGDRGNKVSGVTWRDRSAVCTDLLQPVCALRWNVHFLLTSCARPFGLLQF